MKKLTLSTLALLFVLGTSLYGQEPDPNSPAQQAARTTAFLSQKLKLNQDQRQAVLCAEEDFFMYQKALFEQHAASTGPSDGRRLQLHHKRQRCQQKIFAVLRADQAELYQQYLDGLKPR